MRVFWQEVTVEEEGGGHAVRLDGRALKTPAKADLRLPTRALAEAMAAEWRAQAGEVRPDTMPLTRAANSAIDRVSLNCDAVIAEITGYGASDLLCYRAPHPEELAAKQAAAWNPLLAWAAEALRAPLAVTSGVMHLRQSAASLDALETAVRGHSAWDLTALFDLVSISGSLVIGLAISRGQITASEAWPLSRIDEAWNIAQWGEDAEAAAQSEARRLAFVQAERLLRLLNGLS